MISKSLLVLSAAEAGEYYNIRCPIAAESKAVITWAETHKPPMKLLIDADYIVYKSCAAAETEVDFGDDVILVTSNFSDAYKATNRELTKIEDKFGAFSSMILFFSDSENFRKKILPEYKGHRNRKKPCGYKRVIKH